MRCMWIMVDVGEHNGEYNGECNGEYDNKMVNMMVNVMVNSDKVWKLGRMVDS